MTGITKDRIADEAFETAALLVSHSLRIAHQHQLVRLIGTLERRMYIMIIVAHEPAARKIEGGERRFPSPADRFPARCVRPSGKKPPIPGCPYWHRAGRAKWPNARYRHIPEPSSNKECLSTGRPTRCRRPYSADRKELADGLPANGSPSGGKSSDRSPTPRPNPDRKGLNFKSVSIDKT